MEKMITHHLIDMQDSKMSMTIASFTTTRYPTTDDTQPMLAIKITPPSILDGSIRRKFHLVLLLDVSGSMADERIDAVKRTLHLLIDALRDDDKLSIITYNYTAKRVAEAVDIDVDGRRLLHAAVDGLCAEGGTNLESALVCLRSLNISNRADAVFILTDGHINQGLSSASALTRLVCAAVAPGTPVNTLGYGAEHNARLLRDMAMRSRGSYTFADAAEMIPAIIGDIVGGLETEQGRNAQLMIPAGWSCMEISTSDEIAASYNIGTLIADKPQWVVLTGPAGITTYPEFTFRYEDGTGTHTVVYDPNVTTVVDVCAAEQWCRVRVAAVFVSVAEMLEAHRMDDANAALLALASELEASSAKDRTFVIGLRAQVDESLETIRNMNLHAHAHFTLSHNPVTLSSVVSRFHSNTAALGVQRGFFTSLMPTASRNPSVAPAAPASPSTPPSSQPLEVTHSFSSPSQRNATTRMTEHYSQQSMVP
jgi:hypothetical protein